MSITSKTRKLLWGRSGNRCAICRCLITGISDEKDEHTVVGVECHIIASSLNGTRGSLATTVENLDSYENLILLCSTHHKEIDDHPSRFTPSKLQQIKKAHEQFVEIRTDVYVFNTDKSLPSKVSASYLVRLSSGKELWRILNGCEAAAHDYDELRNIEEKNAVADFLQSCQDYGDLSDVLDVRDVLELEFSLSEALLHLEGLGLYVFGGIGVSKWAVPSNTIPLKTVFLRVIRNDNHEIIRL